MTATQNPPTEHPKTAGDAGARPYRTVNPYTGEFITNGPVRGAAFGVPGLESALGREGVLTAYYGNPRQVMFTVGYKL